MSRPHAQAAATLIARRVLARGPGDDCGTTHRDRTLLGEWAYIRPWSAEGQRTGGPCPVWLHTYNHHRRHTAIGGPLVGHGGNAPGHYT